MQTIEIAYDDGSAEFLDVRLEGFVLADGQHWAPGHLVSPPFACGLGSDFFEAAIGEGGFRSGEERPDPGDADPASGAAPWRAFSWKLVGSDADACREKLQTWADRLGAGLDPYAAGRDYLDGGLMRVLDDASADEYDRDMSCVVAFLDDPREEARLILAEKDPAPAGPRR